MMKMRAETDAMQTMGLDPVDALVLPRVMALIIMVALLTWVADIAGPAGAAFSVAMIMDLARSSDIATAQHVVTPWMFWSGRLKAP